MAATATATSPPPALYTHTKGQHWGLAILAWERGSSRGYQFEDGVLRVFNRAYYELLEEVVTPADRAAQVVSDLRRKLVDRTSHHDSPVEIPPAVPDVSFDDQMRGFRKRFPKGFDDPTWIARYRGNRGGRRARSHAEPAFAEARAALAVNVVDRALAEMRASEVVAASVRLLENSNLVSGTQLAPLRELPTMRQIGFVHGLRELLHGHEAHELRFERLVAALTQFRKRNPTWQLVTALPALFSPEEEICVRPSTFLEQAKWMAPRLVVSSTPSGTLYRRLVDMARSVKSALEKDGLTPRDMMDVYHFMVITLAPSAKLQPAP